jgi:hypothetical protein
MIDVFVRRCSRPDDCRECPFLNQYDECILMTEKENQELENFIDMNYNCPLIDVETHFFTPVMLPELAEEIFSKREMANMYTALVRYSETLKRENRELKKELKEVKKRDRERD